MRTDDRCRLSPSGNVLFAGTVHHLPGWQIVNYAALPIYAIIAGSLGRLYRLNRPASPALQVELP